MPRRRKKKPMNSDGSGLPCAYCKRTLASAKSRSEMRATRDHVQPKHLGGGYRVWCCFVCNNMKGGMTIVEWEFFMTHNPDWWTKPYLARAVHRMVDKLRTGGEFYDE